MKPNEAVKKTNPPDLSTPVETQLLKSKDTTSYRIIHTADWHLGKHLMDQERHADHQQFLDFFLDTVKSHGVDAVIISGDIFDGVNPPAKSEELYYITLAALHSLGVAAVVISGNHDSPTMLRSASTVIGKLGHHIITDVPEGRPPHIVLLPSPEQPRIAIAAIPFMREGDLRKVELNEDIIEIRERVRAGWCDLYSAAAEAVNGKAPGLPAIATGHLTVTGGVTNKDTEREIRIGGVGDVDLLAFPKRFGYVALGHLHRPQSFPKNVPGGGHIRYAGSPIALGFSEGGHQKAFQVIDVEASGNLNISTIPISGNRRLIQLRGTTRELEEQINNLSAPAQDELQPWVELVLTSDETFQSANSLSATLKGLVTAKGYVPVGGVQRDIPDDGVSTVTERTTDELLSELDIIRENEYGTIKNLMERLLDRDGNPAEFDAMLALLQENILEPRGNA